LAKPSQRRTSQFQLSGSQPQPSKPVLQNNFVAGLKTEFTGLNFPENACTAASNCVFNRVGNITRRKGIDFETGFSTTPISRFTLGINTFIWRNVGGDGVTEVLVVQVGGTLYFYQYTNATTLIPLSGTKLSTTISLSSFVAFGSSLDVTKECQFTAGNGYLFVFHPSCDPFYCTFASGTITANIIQIQIRDFVGIPETIADNTRPVSLSAEHQYNLYNQGWSNANAYTTTSNQHTTGITVGSNTFSDVAASLGAVNGDNVNLYLKDIFGRVDQTASGTVTSYSGTTLVINVTSASIVQPVQNSATWTIYKINAGLLSTWFTAEGNYPSNADVWWTFKNTSGVFAPATTVANVTLGGPAPKGSFLLSAFTQQRSTVSGIAGLTDITTIARPKAGAWFQGRVWYTGVDASFPASGDEPFTTWTENIYFSQIIQKVQDFGKCYQLNDPTSETLNTLLPTDGGVIVIQGSGSIYKLFPLQNGILAFAANGIWFITGAQGVGFEANNYTITKISGIKSISPSSFIDINGNPAFWNNDAIYMVVPSMQESQASLGQARAGLSVQNLTLPTIQTFFQNIPTDSKKFARGDYNPITGIVQWCYRSTQETDITSRYTFDSILNFNMFTQSFYPWTVDTTSASVQDIKYIQYTQLNSPPAAFKYLATSSSNLTFAEERDSVLWKDWNSTGIPVNYVSTFTTAYKLDGDYMRKFQPQYLYMFLNNLVSTSFQYRGQWNFSSTFNSGKWSSLQQVNTNIGEFLGYYRRLRIRGNGIVLQLQVVSTDAMPFDLMGWSILETQNAGV
jgi:hypothetical protein